MSSGLRIGIIDADPFVREGRVMLIQSQPNMQIVFESGDPASSLEVIGDYLVDAVVLDARIPGWSTDEYVSALARTLEENGNDAAIIVTTTFSTPNFELRNLLAGASSVISSELGAQALLKGVTVASNSDFPVSRSHLEALLADESIAPNAMLAVSLERMDDSQSAVLKAMLNGATDTQISKELGLTKYRVTKFLDSLKGSCGLRTRTQLALGLLGLGAF